MFERKYINIVSYLVSATLFLAACGGNEYTKNQTSLPEVIDFNYHVKPILSDRCFACHGFDKNAIKADLRLDIPEGSIEKVLNSGEHAIVPGNVHKSEAFQRIISDDPELRMPPPESGLTMTEEEIAIIAKWIEQGAEYKPHWAFIPPSQPNIPEVENEGWVNNPIDNFVLKKLERKKISPNQKADKENLLRRVTLDLTGLPPTIKEIDDFLADESDRAYEKVVDRLLVSPAYGERMALEWMDVARYADSHGYSTDGYRMMWPWRDWVIKSFNENMPFDEFITWQIAGDKLPNATKEQRLATAFLRNQKLNAEGGIVPEEFLVEYAADRAETVSTAFLGLTFQCAKCHDHKYDPISQKNYFELFSFFNSVNERGLTQNDGNSGPQVLLTSNEAEEKIAFINQQIKEQELQMTKGIKAIDPSGIPRPKIDLSDGLLVDITFEKTIDEKIRNNAVADESFRLNGEAVLVEGKNGMALKFTGYDQLDIRNPVLDFERSDEFSFSFWLSPHHENEYMPILFHLGGKNEGYKGYEITVIDGYLTIRLVNGLPANIISVSTSAALIPDKWTHFTFTYDGSSRAKGIDIYVNGKRDEGRVLFDQLDKSIYTKRNGVRLGGIQDYQVDVKGHGTIDDLKIYNRVLSGLEAVGLYSGPEVLSTPPSPEDLLQHYLLANQAEFEEINQKIKALREEKFRILDTIPSVMVMQDLPEPRPTYLLKRGAYDAPGEQVQPGTPDIILPFAKEFENDRLGLTKWLLDKKNPLTARVIVNRYWQIFFGQGIVKTVEDFGSQGALPHHPELLDYLAYSFIESGWDLKKTLKEITLSSTYQQSSRVSEEIRLSDPENALLARGPSHRLQAEIIRDCALAASGLLTKKIGGPSARPYQPEGLWAEITGNSRILDKYRMDNGEQLYRRGLYTFWRRTSPPPSMVTFDAPTRDLCIVKREGTNTPLQALVLLNDPQFFEAARVLAERVLAAEKGLKEQITLAHRLLTGLFPQKEVLDLLARHYSEQKEQFSENPELVDQLLGVGHYPTSVKLVSYEVAAMSIVCNVIMSFDETIVKR